MQLRRWSEARLVLSQFVLNEFLDPKAEEWYEGAIMAG